MKNKLLLIALLVNATAQVQSYTDITKNYFPADNVHSWENVARLAASKDAHPEMVKAYINQVNNEVFTQQVFTGVVTTVIAGIMSCRLADWYQNYKVRWAKKRLEIARLMTETKRIKTIYA